MRMTPEQIKQARIKAGFTQKSVADAMGVSISTVQKWEQGLRNLTGPTLRVFKEITKCK